MRTVVVCDDKLLATKVRNVVLRNALDCPESHVAPISSAVDSTLRLRADLAVFVLPPDHGAAVAALREMREASHAHVVAVGPADDAKHVLRTLREGAHEYLDATDLEVELSNAIQRLRLSSSPENEPGKVIVVFGPSGGSGSSTVAVNVATVLAGAYERVAALDLRLEAGDLAPLLDLKPTHTLADLCRNLQRLDRSMFEQVLLPHRSGVHLLAAPASFDDVRHVTAKGTRQAIILARSVFPFVVIDLDRSFGPVQCEALAQADLVLAVLRLDFTSLRNMSRTMRQLEKLGVGKERLRVVVNRHRQPKEISLWKAEEALSLKLSHCIPDDPKNVNRANNRGIPVVLDRPSARVSRCLMDLSASVNGDHRPR